MTHLEEHNFRKIFIESATPFAVGESCSQSIEEFLSCSFCWKINNKIDYSLHRVLSFIENMAMFHKLYTNRRGWTVYFVGKISSHSEVSMLHNARRHYQATLDSNLENRPNTTKNTSLSCLGMWGSLFVGKYTKRTFLGLFREHICTSHHFSHHESHHIIRDLKTKIWPEVKKIYSHSVLFYIEFFTHFNQVIECPASLQIVGNLMQLHTVIFCRSHFALDVFIKIVFELSSCHPRKVTVGKPEVTRNTKPNQQSHIAFGSPCAERPVIAHIKSQRQCNTDCEASF